MLLYNSVTKSKEVFEPIDKKHVRMYVCGPTVYSAPHIGNARSAVVFDILYRVLKSQFSQVTYARNITDIDDKINQAAINEKCTIAEIAARYEKIYLHDVTALNCLIPDIQPKATEHMSEMIAAIQLLIDKEHAYVAEGHVLFHVPSYKEYGQISKRNSADLIAGARVEIAPYKRDPTDFVLWKPSTPELPGWNSPWGRGRPGWHTECTVMIQKHFESPIDIHGGGQDLIFPHHENERAQGCCLQPGKEFCRFWVHNGFVNVDKDKMSKSLGNVLLVKDLLKESPAEVIRMALLLTHYRQPLQWHTQTLMQARQLLDRFYRALQVLEDVTLSVEAKVPEAIVSALIDDLNTPQAFTELQVFISMAHKANTQKQREQAKSALLASGNLLGLFQQKPMDWFTQGRSLKIAVPEIEALLVTRAEARSQKDFVQADKIRGQLLALGIIIEDHPEGSVWRVEVN